MAKCTTFLGCFWKTPNSDQESPEYIRKEQSQLLEKGIKSSSADNITEYCYNEESQILQPRHKYYRNSNHHRIVQRRQSI